MITEVITAVDASCQIHERIYLEVNDDPVTYALEESRLSADLGEERLLMSGNSIVLKVAILRPSVGTGQMYGRAVL